MAYPSTIKWLNAIFNNYTYRHLEPIKSVKIHPSVNVPYHHLSHISFYHVQVSVPTIYRTPITIPVAAHHMPSCNNAALHHSFFQAEFNLWPMSMTAELHQKLTQCRVMAYKDAQHIKKFGKESASESLHITKNLRPRPEHPVIMNSSYCSRHWFS